MSSKNATLWTEAGWLILRADFSREAMDAWKAEIPPKYRRWDPEQKLWKFDPSQAVALEGILKRFDYEIHTVEQKQQIVVADGASSADEFIDLLPSAVLKDAYRKACVELHPDHGGTQEQMSRLNAAWFILKQKRGL